MQQTMRQSRIPEQQGIGQTLPPVPVGIDSMNVPPLPPGAMPTGTRLQVGKYQVIIHNFIAEGGFAHVYLARIEGKMGYVVLKRVAVPDQERLKMVEKEIEFMRRLGDHKNIVRYYSSRIDALPTGGFEALILMEYCPGGGVIDLMNRRLQQRLTEPEILKIFSDVAEALAYMHYCNPPVLHRDLKVENILILNQDHYKLCDFGSASLSKGNYIPHNMREIQKLEDDIQRHTTLQYRAPEMIDIYQKRPINEKADIWAMGVLLYKLCYYTTPFEEEGQLAILNARYSIPNNPMFSDGLRHLMMSMLQEDQNRRPNIYQVMNAVCQLRGIECPIRDIYSEQPILSPPSSLSPPETDSSIFESVPMPANELPNVTPMRRGRPTKNDKPINDSYSHQHQNSNGSSHSYDPFDPKVKNTTSTSDDSYSFQNSFISDTRNNDNDNNLSRVHSAPLIHSIPVPHTPKTHTQPQSPTTGISPVKSVSSRKVEEAKDDEPKMNKRVASSIEARFMAIKNAGRNNANDSQHHPSHTTTPPSSSLPKKKPIPPPKPARLRSKPQTAAMPDVDEFENKFPPLEEFDKQLSVE